MPILTRVFHANSHAKSLPYNTSEAPVTAQRCPHRSTSSTIRGPVVSSMPIFGSILLGKFLFYFANWCFPYLSMYFGYVRFLVWAYLSFFVCSFRRYFGIVISHFQVAIYPRIGHVCRFRRFNFHRLGLGKSCLDRTGIVL